MEYRADRKCTTWKLIEWKMHNLEDDRMENARHGKWQKIHMPENGRKYTP